MQNFRIIIENVEFQNYHRECRISELSSRMQNFKIIIENAEFLNYHRECRISELSSRMQNFRIIIENAEFQNYHPESRISEFRLNHLENASWLVPQSTFRCIFCRSTATQVIITGHNIPCNVLRNTATPVFDLVNSDLHMIEVNGLYMTVMICTMKSL